MSPLETAQLSLLITLLGLLGGGAMLCLLLLWMFRQQRLLDDLFDAFMNLRRENREAQRELLLIFRSPPRTGRASDFSIAPSPQEHAKNKKEYGLTLDELKILAAFLKAEGGDPASTSVIHLGLLRD